MPRPMPTMPPVPSWRTPLRMGRDLVRREGWTGPVFRVLKKIGYRRVMWLVRPVDEPMAANVPEGFALRRLTEADADAYDRSRPIPPGGDCRTMLAQGHRGYAAWCGDRVASVTWVGTGRVRLLLLDRMLTIEPDEWYLFDSYTHPAFRGRRLQAALVAQIRADAEAAGRRYLACVVEPHNRPNIASRVRCGFRPLGITGRVGFGACGWHFSRGPRRLPG